MWKLNLTLLFKVFLHVWKSMLFPLSLETRALAEDVSSRLMELITIEDDREGPEGSADTSKEASSSSTSGGIKSLHSFRAFWLFYKGYFVMLTFSVLVVLWNYRLCHFYVLFFSEVNNQGLDLGSVMEVLLKQLRNTPVPCKTAVLRWIYHLHNKIPNKVIIVYAVDVTFRIHYWSVI